MTNRLGMDDLVDMLTAAATDDPHMLGNRQRFQDLRALRQPRSKMPRQHACHPENHRCHQLSRAKSMPPEDEKMAELDAFVQKLNLG